MEDYADESLRILSESGVDSQEVKKPLKNIRDEGYHQRMNFNVEKDEEVEDFVDKGFKTLFQITKYL